MERRPDIPSRPPDATTTRIVAAAADKATPAQQWAAAWLAGDHRNDLVCPTCAAGWALGYRDGCGPA